ncbi:DUF2779 domain-containing protein [Endomicrobium proavitum]|uniref:DUF2779 domain-containing protein n=1 Tax=Endomicrobium proavitum TaxID=1408281 RepID=A0A0G3WIN9_9BACT|nr:DUF2779 domain-containing protein [Endomicrobium proavitum]AKL97755.1 hypothetical protein Epro_0376 [Endomicrobium proavitum]
MNYINKTVFLNYFSCPTLGWLSKRRKLPKLTGLNNEVLILEGNNVHEKSHVLFAGAVNAKTGKHQESVEYTKKLVADENVKSIVEASFVADGFSVRVDALERLSDGSWHFYEVKSGSKYKVKYVQDMSFSAMVLAKSGLKVANSTLLHLSHEYNLGMDDSKLFTALDCTQRVALRVPGYLEYAPKIFEDIESETMPAPSFKRQCKNCPVFEECLGKGVKNSIFDLPRLSIPAMEELVLKGIDTIDKVPEDFELTDMQRIVRNCVITGTTYISENLKTEIENIKPPFYYLDFESVTTIMPLYPNVAPHTQLLTQFSIHKSEVVGEVRAHYEYIADHTKDCRREIAEKLIEYLGDGGSIITYANFEHVAILRLAAMFPDLCEKLQAVAARIVDFELIIRKNYYDIRFHGKSSIKKVLPVMIADMSYAQLEIGEGGDASAAFAFMAMGLYDKEKIEQTKANLLKYCAQDTLALVKIHRFLHNITIQSNV